MSPQPKKVFRPRPVVCVWEGDVFRPLPRFQQLCDRQFAVHEEYPLMIVEERSQASHNHYFAAVAEAFNNLSEEWENRFPTSEHLRAWSLVQEGYCTENTYVCSTPAEARKLAATLRQLAPLSVISLKGNVVQHFVPESQSQMAMKKERFEASKAAVLARVASMARTTPAQLRNNAGRSA